MIPLQTLDIMALSEGPAIAIVGLLALLFWASIRYPNPAATIMWGISLIALVMSNLYELRDELFWFAILVTVLLVVIGISVRMRR